MIVKEELDIIKIDTPGFFLNVTSVCHYNGVEREDSKKSNLVSYILSGQINAR
jgi:hypothetical protein